jgi:hypothetical protein
MINLKLIFRVTCFLAVLLSLYLVDLGVAMQCTGTVIRGLLSLTFFSISTLLLLE